MSKITSHTQTLQTLNSFEFLEYFWNLCDKDENLTEIQQIMASPPLRDQMLKSQTLYGALFNAAKNNASSVFSSLLDISQAQNISANAPQFNNFFASLIRNHNLAAFQFINDHTSWLQENLIIPPDSRVHNIFDAACCQNCVDIIEFLIATHHPLHPDALASGFLMCVGSENIEAIGAIVSKPEHLKIIKDHPSVPRFFDYHRKYHEEFLTHVEALIESIESRQILNCEIAMSPANLQKKTFL